MSIYNGQDHLGEAIESILCQSFGDFEFLIMNDGSVDDSRRIVLSYDDPRIRLIDNPENLGLTESLNRGLSLATSSLIARQDQDDISHPTRFEKQLAFMEQNPDVVLLGTQARLINQKGRTIRCLPIWRPTTASGIRWKMMTSSAFIHASVMFRKEVLWDKFGGYDARYEGRDDAELWSRIAFECPVANLPQKLVDHRRHSTSMTATYEKVHANNLERVLIRNMRFFLKEQKIPDEWARFISWRNNSRILPPIDNPDRLLQVISEMWKRFLEVGASPNDDLKRCLATDYIRTAMSFVENNKLLSLRAFILAIIADWRPAVIILPRFIASLCLEPSIKKALRHRQHRTVSKKCRS